jgi:hypothetical protein
VLPPTPGAMLAGLTGLPQSRASRRSAPIRAATLGARSHRECAWAVHRLAEQLIVGGGHWAAGT